MLLLHVAYGAFDERLRGRRVDVRQFIDVDAGAAAHLVLAELFEERAIL